MHDFVAFKTIPHGQSSLGGKKDIGLKNNCSDCLHVRKQRTHYTVFMYTVIHLCCCCCNMQDVVRGEGGAQKSVWGLCFCLKRNDVFSETVI